MEADTTLLELWRIKDELGSRFNCNPRAICSDLSAKQDLRGDEFPLVTDMRITLARHAQRMAGLPPQIPLESFMKDDPIIAETHRIREQRHPEQEGAALILKDEPPGKGQ